MTENLSYNLDAEEKQKKSQKRAEQKKQRELSDIRKLLDHPEFRRYLWRELSRTGVFSPSFTLNSVQTAFNEGARSIGISLLVELMEAKPSAFAQIQRENYSEAKSENQEEV